jgi:O-antigen/teichoic acid export membrane protein
MVSADRTKTLAIYNVLSSLVLAVVSITTVVTTQSYEAPILARILVPSLFLPVALILMLKAIPGPLRFPKWASMREMLVYSVPLGLASMLGTITLQMHAVIVAALCTPEDFAVYINGAIEIPLISIVTGSITTVVFAEMAELCSKGDKAGALKLFHTASIKSACILFPTMCFLLATAQPFIIFLFSDQYKASVMPFVIYLFVLPIRIVVYGSALMALGMTHVILMRSILDLAVNCLLCFFLVKAIGYIGAAIAIVLTLYLWTTPYNLYMIGKGFNVSWHKTLPFRNLFKIFQICLLCVPLAFIGAHALPINSFIQFTLSALLYFPILYYVLYRRNLISLFHQFKPLI